MEFLSYFGEVFIPINFGLLLLGTVGGLLLGATPGLSPTMAVALLIPFTFRLEPAQGLILLGAAYTSTVAGGAVSAILLKIPGAPANIATTLDGHTMAKQGRGAEALQLSFLASAVGGLFGVFLLIFLNMSANQFNLFQAADYYVGVLEASRQAAVEPTTNVPTSVNIVAFMSIRLLLLGGAFAFMWSVRRQAKEPVN